QRLVFCQVGVNLPVGQRHLPLLTGHRLPRLRRGALPRRRRRAALPAAAAPAGHGYAATAAGLRASLCRACALAIRNTSALIAAAPSSTGTSSTTSSSPPPIWPVAASTTCWIAVLIASEIVSDSCGANDEAIDSASDIT